MSINDIRTRAELAQYTVKRAEVALRVSGNAFLCSPGDVSVMHDTARILLQQAYEGLDRIVSDLTAMGHEFSQSEAVSA